MKNRFVNAMLAASVLSALILPASISAEDTKEVLVPLRSSAEALGADVQWLPSDKAIRVSLGDKEWRVQLNQSQSTLNGGAFNLSSAPVQNKELVTLVSLASFNKALAVDVDWNSTDGINIEHADTRTKALYFMARMKQGKFENAEQLLNSSLKVKLPIEQLSLMPIKIGSLFGTSWTLLKADSNQSLVHRNERLVYKTPQGAVFALELRFDKQGLLDDIGLVTDVSSNYKAPSYDHPDQYIEKEVVIGQSPFQLPGVLTLPKGEGKFPVVVLVHGSGPNDRDESIGGSKMFRDLAGGLANKGIAVLRYDKRTREYPIRSDFPKFTVKEETIDDAIYAVQALKAEEKIDTSQIYVLGHSQGGMLIPRILEADTDKSIAGAMLMAAPSGSLEDLVIKQYEGAIERYRAAGVPESAIAQIEQVIQYYKIIKDPQYSKDNLPQQFPLGNAYWWYDFRNYSGPEIAKKQQVPLFIAQGENDVQVDKSNLDVWKQDLAGRSNVVYKSYPALTHLFVPYDKPSTGNEYALSANVPEQVVLDLADWIHSKK
ncbi:alpha/beta fold hydrolase [Paenibacillus sediminis]|uniref:Dienelactone hydrolase n=1 Tax=Paenibacillus sediminis TaxID=664909 RepID=A0ABS4H6C8_9BACL|nr:alpha/beta fold hydrolase [Paenibacillus sediminis]MBP1937917.1 dienelactone hydrolase [Paenibacillus sediminis]